MGLSLYIVFKYDKYNLFLCFSIHILLYSFLMSGLMYLFKKKTLMRQSIYGTFKSGQSMGLSNQVHLWNFQIWSIYWSIKSGPSTEQLNLVHLWDYQIRVIYWTIILSPCIELSGLVHLWDYQKWSIYWTFKSGPAMGLSKLVHLWDCQNWSMWLSNLVHLRAYKAGLSH